MGMSPQTWFLPDLPGASGGPAPALQSFLLEGQEACLSLFSPLSLVCPSGKCVCSAHLKLPIEGVCRWEGVQLWPHARLQGFQCTSPVAELRHTNVHTCTHPCTYTCILMHTPIATHIHVYPHAHMCTHTDTHVHAHTYAHVHTHTFSIKLACFQLVPAHQVGSDGMLTVLNTCPRGSDSAITSTRDFVTKRNHR